MSLFELKVIWDTQISTTEEFDAKHLAIGPLDDETQQRIAVASYAGQLRIYKPSKKYSQKDLLFQTNIGEPIVQIKIGKFMGPGNSLGILLLKKLIVMFFGASKEGGLVSKSQDFVLPAPCHSFLENPLIASSLNSQLHFIAPPSKIDLKVGTSIFPICNSAATNNIYLMDGQELVMMNGSMEQWRVVLGEVASMHLHSKSHSDEIVCVGGNCYWIVDEMSNIMQSKHIQNEISASQIVQLSTGYNILLGTFSQHLFIYHNGKLIWAAKCHFAPVSIHCITMNNKKNLLSLLSDLGNLEVCYLGMEAPIKQTENKTVDMKQIQQDIVRLENQPKNQQKIEDKEENCVKLLASTNVQWTDEYVEGGQLYFTHDGNIRQMTVTINLTTTKKIKNVKIQLKLPQNLRCQKIEEIQELSNTHSISVKVYALRDKFPYSRHFDLVCTYLKTTTKIRVEIPLLMQCIKSKSKLEKAQHKIILVASQELPKLSQFYKIDDDPATSLTFKLSNDVEASVVCSKNSAKYKIQSDSYEGICLLLLDFIDRCDRLKIILSIESVPLQELFMAAQSHFKCRKELVVLYQALEKGSVEFRQIQKRILLKIKEKSSELNNLDLVLANSHRLVVDCCNKIEEQQQKMKKLHNQLMISIIIVCELLFLRGRTSPQGRKILYGVLSVQEQSEVDGWGWQEQLIVNSSMLLRKKITQEQLGKMEYDRVRKTLLWLVDKTAKGELII